MENKPKQKIILLKERDNKLWAIIATNGLVLCTRRGMNSDEALAWATNYLSSFPGQNFHIKQEKLEIPKSK